MTVSSFDNDLITVFNRDDAKVGIEFHKVVVGPEQSGTNERTRTKGDLSGVLNLDAQTAVEFGKLLIQRGQAHLDLAAQQQADQDDEQPADVEALEEFVQETPEWIDKTGTVWLGEEGGALTLRGGDPEAGSHSWAAVEEILGPLNRVIDSP